MKPLRFKAESRVLSVAETLCKDAHGKRVLVFVVYRGAKFLDGVYLTPLDKRSMIRALVAAITGSRFFPELRAIILSDAWVRKNKVQLGLLHRETGLPVVSYALPESRRTVLGQSSPINRRIRKLAGLSERSARELLAIACHSDGSPEALRVAMLLAGRWKPVPFPTSRKPRAAGKE